MDIVTFGKLTPAEIINAAEGHKEAKLEDYKLYRLGITVLVNMLATKAVSPEEVMSFGGEKVPGKRKRLDQSTPEGRKEIDKLIRETNFGD